ncbi:MAG: response regulator transcription factor [Acidobacteriota bacterium]
MPIRVLLVDDHQLVREGFRSMLEGVVDIEVVGSTGESRLVPDLVARLRPDVVVLDLMMPGPSGLDLAGLISHGQVAARIVVLTMYCDPAYVHEAFRKGAVGYVLKGSSRESLVEAIRSAAGGEYYLCPELDREAIDAFARRARGASLDYFDALTAREREVLQLAALGLLNKQIAARLSISVRTVETHRARLMRKLGLGSQTDLVRYAMRKGILPPDFQM